LGLVLVLAEICPLAAHRVARLALGYARPRRSEAFLDFGGDHDITLRMIGDRLLLVPDEAVTEEDE
jgi:hypothetical protein